MKTCNAHSGLSCSFATLNTAGTGCSYTGKCEYQLPKDECYINYSSCKDTEILAKLEEILQAILRTK